MEIQKLDIKLCQDLTGKCLETIITFEWLKEFTFTDIFRSIRGTDFVCLYQLRNLVRLNLSETDVGDLLFIHALSSYR